MAEHTRIEWTDATWNPVTGCTRVGPGCDRLKPSGSPNGGAAPRSCGAPYEQGFDLRLWPDRLPSPPDGVAPG